LIENIEMFFFLLRRTYSVNSYYRCPDATKTSRSFIKIPE